MAQILRKKTIGVEGGSVDHPLSEGLALKYILAVTSKFWYF